MGGLPEPLSSQLSRALVAFTIEADDEFEHRMPHRTTNHGLKAGGSEGERIPWLVSLIMWSTCVRFVPPDGVAIRSYARSAWWLTPKGISTTLRRMGGWWGYLALDNASDDGSPSPGDRIIRLTPGGRRARRIWEPLTQEIESRWQDRFGRSDVEALRSTLAELVEGFDTALPDCLRLYDVNLERQAPSRQVAGSLPGLLSQALIRFELDFERDHPVPMAVCGNVLRILGGGPLPVRDLSARSGLAPSGVEAGLRTLQQCGLATVGPDPTGKRLRVVALTRTGLERRQQAAALVETIEERWRRRYGRRLLRTLIDALNPIVADPDDPEGPLWRGLYRYPDGWRSSLPRPDTLPRHPLVSHRGGYLDGA